MSSNPRGVETARAHIDKSREILGQIHSLSRTLTPAENIALAQVHATLALAEGTRTRNMLVASQIEYGTSDDVIRRVND
jgi:hypothetical protein